MKPIISFGICVSNPSWNQLKNLGSAFETVKPGPYQMMTEINGDDRWEPRRADLFQNVVLPLSLVCSLTYGNHLLGISP
jgi:hypothetical protein